MNCYVSILQAVRIFLMGCYVSILQTVRIFLDGLLRYYLAYCQDFSCWFVTLVSCTLLDSS